MTGKTMLFVLFAALVAHSALAQPNWTAIKANVSFTVHDTAFLTPTIQPLHNGGWEDGLYITRDGRRLYSTYLPIDVFSWLGDFGPCIDFGPYYRPPLLGIDTLTNPFNCPNYIHSDIIYASRGDSGQAFTAWSSSNLQTSATFEGAACGVLLNADSFDVFVYTRDIGDPVGMEIFLLQNVPVNPNTSTAVQILSSPDHDDNPHIERINDSTLLVFFDRERSIYYSLSRDNGSTWDDPTLVTNVLNDQAPYDVQPHLWHDGTDWWMFFCAANDNGIRSIFKSKQMTANDWNSWGPKQAVIEATPTIAGGVGTAFGIGEPSLTAWGDLSFVVVYGDLNSADTTDVYDCDPWMLKRKHPISTGVSTQLAQPSTLRLFPNPAADNIFLQADELLQGQVHILNALGKVVLTVPYTPSQPLDISELPSGIYFLQFSHQPEKALKFVKQ